MTTPTTLNQRDKDLQPQPYNKPQLYNQPQPYNAEREKLFVDVSLKTLENIKLK